MATPVPVVSIIYFFVSVPPKTFIIVRPAVLATSLKYARGCAGLEVFFGGSSTANTKETETRAANEARSIKKKPRRCPGLLKNMTSLDGRLRTNGGQVCVLGEWSRQGFLQAC